MPTTPVWMTQFEIADLFGVFSCCIRKAIHTIYKNKELNECDTMKYIKQPGGISYDVYNLEMVIAIALDRKSTRLNSSHANISYAVFGLKKKSDMVASMSGCDVGGAGR